MQCTQSLWGLLCSGAAFLHATNASMRDAGREITRFIVGD